MGERLVVALFLVEEMERRGRRAPVNVHRRRLRDTMNPFEIGREEFINLYRLPQEGAMALVESLAPHFGQNIRRTGIRAHIRVLCALLFFSGGSYQRRVGQNYLHPLIQTEGSRSIKMVSDAINLHLLATWVKFPRTPREKQAVKDRIMERARFPGVLGAVDGTHIAIVPPGMEREHIYFNRKHFHSKNVQIVSSYDLRILAVNAQHGGRSHDAHIWRASRLREHMEMCFLQGNHSSWLNGDSAFPLEPWLMTPFLGAAEGNPEARYNTRFVAATNCVERCIGVWKGWFRCLRRDRTLNYSPERAGIIINACAVLHNMAQHYRVPHPEPHFEENVYVDMVGVEVGEANAIWRRLVHQHFA